MGLPLLRQPWRTAVQQLKCDQLFTWPSDQPRHATCTSITRSKLGRPLSKEVGGRQNQKAVRELDHFSGFLGGRTRGMICPRVAPWDLTDFLNYSVAEVA